MIGCIFAFEMDGDRFFKGHFLVNKCSTIHLNGVEHIIMNIGSLSFRKKNEMKIENTIFGMGHVTITSKLVRREETRRRYW